METLFNPTSVAVVIIVVVCFFLWVTREGWNKKVKGLRLSWKGKNTRVSSGYEQSEQDKPTKARGLTTELNKLGINSSGDFEKFVSDITDDLNKKDK